ncbi:MAG: hypothetical protein RLZZ15_1577, partial [Verrucomicrobiota bacterium]
MTTPCLTVSALGRCLVLVGALGAFSSGVFAQSATAATASPAAGVKVDTILLTPFQVSTDKDNGYAAGNTLSGGRADTPLKITSASISVMTKEFLDDFAITDMNEAAAWTVGMNAPTGGESGPFGGNRFQADFRGAGNGANYPSRNGALEYFVADSYNTERMEFSRGPNAALFGDAGPGGMQGSSSKLARLNNRQSSVSFRGDSYGGYRATLDANYGVDKVAVRFNALRQNTKAFQDGTGNFQEAFTLDASYKISQNTQLRAEYSKSHEWNIQYRRTYNENASLWNRTTFNDTNTTLNTAGTGLSTYGSTTADRLVWNFGTNSLINYRAVQYQTNGLGYAIPWHGRPEFANFQPGISKTFFLGPADAIASRDLNSRNITLDHRFSPSLFLQTSFISSDIDPTQINTANPPNDYRVDVNRLLPSGATNPNFGKAYSEGSDSRQYQANNVTEFRFIATYQFEAPKMFQMKQRFSLNGGWRQDLYEAWQRAWRRVDNTAVPNPTNAVNTL